MSTRRSKDLHSLPLELFQRIIHLSILTQGLERGLRLRLVCHHFSEQVHEVLFLHNMLDGVISDWGRMPPFIASYIECRVLKEPPSGHPMLLCIRQVAERLTSDPEVGRQHIKSLCALVAPRIQSIFSRFKPPWETLSQDIVEEHVKVAALYLKGEVSEHVSGYSCSMFGLSSNLVAKYGSKELFELHLKRGSANTANLCMALRNAARHGRMDLVELSLPNEVEMVPWKYDHDQKKWNVQETLAVALCTPSPKIWDYIFQLHQKYGLPVAPRQQANLLTDCARYGWIDMTQHLLKQGTDPNAVLPVVEPQSHFRRPIIIAAEAGHTDIVAALLDYGAEIPPGTVAAAASAGHLKVIRLLVAHNASTAGGIVAAAKRGYGDIVQLLLENGADANETDGRIPAIGYAVITEHTRMFDCLLKSNARLPEPDVREKCSQKAKAKGVESMIALLER